MHEGLQKMVNDDSLGLLLRSNLSCHCGKTITQELLAEISQQIVDSIYFFMKNKGER